MPGPTRYDKQGRPTAGYGKYQEKQKKKKIRRVVARGGSAKQAAAVAGGYTDADYVSSGDLSQAKQVARKYQSDAREIAARAAKRPGFRTHYTNEQVARQDERSAKARLEALSNLESLQSPQAALIAATEGVEPSEKLKEQFPRVYREALARAVRANEGIEADPVVKALVGEGDLKSTLDSVGGQVVTAVGVGGAIGKGAKIAGSALKARRAARAGDEAAEVLDRAGRVVGKTKARRIKRSGRRTIPAGRRGQAIERRPVRAPRRAVEAKSAPRSAPSKAAPTIPRVRKVRSAGSRAGRFARSHPVVTTGAAGVLSTNVGVDAPILNEAGALVEGHAKALYENPGKTLETTARAVPGILTGAGQTIGAAGMTVGRAAQTGLDAAGSPVLEKKYSGKEIVSPVKETGEAQIEGLKEMGEKLLSGDPDVVQQAVEDEVGLSLLVPVPRITRAVRESKAYRGARTAARGKVARRREVNRGVRAREGKDITHHPVRDSRTGEEYILRRTGRKIENRRARVEESRNVSREKAVGEREGGLAAKPVVDEVRKIRGGKKFKQQAADAISTVAVYGIPRNLEAAQAIIAKVRRDLDDQIEPGSVPKNLVNDQTNLKFLADNPNLLTDPHFWNAVDAYKRQAKDIEFSSRKLNLAIGDVFKVKRPEERLAEGVQVGGRTIQHPGMDPDTLLRKESLLKKIRATARQAEKDSYDAEPGSSAQLAAIQKAKEAKADAKVLQEDLREFRRGQKQAQKDYDREVAQIRQRENLERPAYVADRQARVSLDAEPRFPRNRMAQKQHRSEGAARASGMADRSFQTLMGESVFSPRMRRAMHRLTSEFVDRNRVSIGGRTVLTSPEIRAAIQRGEIDPEQYAVFHSQHFKQAALDPHKDMEPLDVRTELTTSMGLPMGTRLDRLEKEIGDRAADSGHKYVVVPKERVREFAHQFAEPEGLVKNLQKVNRAGSRIVLNNPSWATSQILAEGIPAAMAVGANPMRWRRVRNAMRDETKLPARDRAASGGLVGQTAGTASLPKTGFSLNTNREAANFYKLARRDRFGPGPLLLSLVKGDALGKFDRWKGGGFRKAVSLAKVDREMNGFLKGLGGSMKLQESIARKIKDKPLAEQQAYLAKHPATARKLENYLDDVMGNWRALTHLESKFAPLVAFYPFVRYSLKWMFWAFPKHHPVKAQILYFLAQQNANELEKLLEGQPVTWGDYALPVIKADGKESVLPTGVRIAPALNAIIDSIGSDSPGKLTSIGTPILSGIGRGIAGIDGFGGDGYDDDWKIRGALVLANMLGMSPALRWTDDLDSPAKLRDVTPRRTSDGTVIGGQGEFSKKFEEADPKAFERALGNVLAPQSGADYKETVQLERELADMFSGGSSSNGSTPDQPFAGEGSNSNSTYVPFGAPRKVKRKKVSRVDNYVPFGG